MGASSSASPEFGIRPRLVLLLGLVCLVSTGLYLGGSAIYYRAGFPLDDSWIHQTYARSLALDGQWSFLPGQSSGGSTSPLWTMLLAVGAWLGMNPVPWSFLLGLLLLWSLALLGETAVRRWDPAYRPRFPWAGTLICLEWHLVWAADSGMETLLQAALTTLILVWIGTGRLRPFQLGLLIGLSLWIRPDGITLLGPAALVCLCGQKVWKQRLLDLVKLGAGFTVPAGFYLLFNLVMAGSVFPTTFYAKQAEYSLYRDLPYIRRLAEQLLQPLVGVGLVLLPGAVISLVLAVREKAWGRLFGLAWILGYLGLYAWRLPVVYQHGRYAIPVMPLFFLFGLHGLARAVGAGAQRRLLGRAWLFLVAGVLLGFWGLGGIAYARDVAVIESEMVVTARWVAENLPPQTRVAAHDIGALGYFGGHELVDLAGLISPEVIPFLRDEAALAVYLDDRQVEYLVAFPDWYPELTEGRRVVFTSGGVYAPTLGSTNMTVYEWSR